MSIFGKRTQYASIKVGIRKGVVVMKIGIVGAGTIVPGFMEALKSVGKVEMYSICGTNMDIEKMESLKEKYSLSKVYTEYAKMLESDIEIVYIAVPNHLHYSFAKQALLMNKHVILEKPFTSNYEEAEDLMKTANQNNRFIFEAISNQYLPNYSKTKELLNLLGDVKIVQLNYSQYSRRYDAFKEANILPAFDVKKSGGALMDINVYNIHFIVGLFGDPISVSYIANIEKGIDTSGILTMEYPTFKCVAIGAKDCKAPKSITIQGDKASIHSASPANGYDAFTLSFNDGKQQEYALNTGKNRLVYEIDTFIEAIKNKDQDTYLQRANHILSIMKILDTARKQVSIAIQGEFQ